jgi:heme oxygenase
MPVTLDEQVRDTVNFNNAKSLADMAQTAMNLSTQNAVSNQAHVQALVNAALANSLTLSQNALQSGMQLSQAITTMATKTILDESVKDAVASQKLIGSDIQDRLMNIEGALSGGQQFAKVAQTTPPQTGTGGAFGSDSGSALLQQIVSTLAIIQSRLDAAKVP